VPSHQVDILADQKGTGISLCMGARIVMVQIRLNHWWQFHTRWG